MFSNNLIKFLILSLSFLICFQAHSEISNPSKHSLKVYDSLIAPVFEARCLHCHGENKDKGKLRMDKKELLLKGGRSAGNEIIVKGDTEASELIYRITLPKNDEEAMPPIEDGKPHHPITNSELTVIKSWIQLGASFDLQIADLDSITQEAAVYILENMPKKVSSEIDLVKPVLPVVSKAPDEIIDTIGQSGVLIMPIAENTNALYVNASYLGTKFDDQMFEMLMPVADQLLWLNLARTKVSDKCGPYLAKLKNLTRLHLENSEVSDEISPFLADLKELKYLNLYGTNISDASISNLKKLPNLNKVFLWQTKITPKGAEDLKMSFADSKLFASLKKQHLELSKKVKVVTQNEINAIQSLEQEIDKIGSVSTDEEVINQKCPVSQKAISEDHKKVFEGRKVAFCCKNCLDKFSKDTGSYRSKIENFKPSESYVRATDALELSRANKDEKIEKVSDELRQISQQLRVIAPEINIGWTYSE